MKANLIKRKERKLEGYYQTRALCEDMLKTADKADVPTIKQELTKCQQKIQELIEEIRELKA